jgi:hypothetical protein
VNSFFDQFRVNGLALPGRGRGDEHFDFQLDSSRRQRTDALGLQSASCKMSRRDARFQRPDGTVNMAHITLSRTSLVGWFLLQGGPFLMLACFPHVGSAAPGNDHTVDASQDPAAKKRDLAIARARETLRTAGVDPSLLTVTSAEPVTWPDSSLGCPQPGIQYLQVLTPGYRVELHGAQRDYLVHVAGKQSIVCTGKAGAPSRLTRPLAPLRGIDLMTQRARQMLAAVVRVPAEQIRVVGFEPQVWPDTGLGCPSPEQSVPGRVSGFRIMLEHGGREYTFNTDLHRVIACPAIDAE